MDTDLKCYWASDCYEYIIGYIYAPRINDGKVAATKMAQSGNGNYTKMVLLRVPGLDDKLQEFHATKTNDDCFFVDVTIPENEAKLVELGYAYSETGSADDMQFSSVLVKNAGTNEDS